MLSTYADKATYSRISYILCLYIAICSLEVACQNETQTITSWVEASNTTAIRYSPALGNGSKWNEQSFGNETEVTTKHSDTSLNFQYTGGSAVQLVISLILTPIITTTQVNNFFYLQIQIILTRM